MMKSKIIKHGLWNDAWNRLRKDIIAMTCLGLVIFFTSLAIYGEIVYQYHNFYDTIPHYQIPNLDNAYKSPSYIHPMGTDGLGRDVMSRLIQGVRIAYKVGIITSLISIPIGVILGCIAGYFGKKIDDIIVWFYSTVASMPGLLFILAIAMIFKGQGLLGIYLGIGLTTWVGLCRLVRGEVLKHKQQTYVQAAQALGINSYRVMFKHILPNIFHIIIITFTIRFPAAVGTEVIMSYLGIGVQDQPSWGLMIDAARMRLWQGMWWEMTFVTIALFLLVLAFNLLGDALRDALDPKLNKS